MVCGPGPRQGSVPGSGATGSVEEVQFDNTSDGRVCGNTLATWVCRVGACSSRKRLDHRRTTEPTHVRVEGALVDQL